MAALAALKYWLWLTTRQGLGTLTAVRLLDQFGTPESAYFADGEEYEGVDGLSAKAKESLEDKDLSGAERILADCDRLGYRLLTLQDAEYPSRLRNIPDPPLLLYLKGRLPPVDEELVIGMVGARKASEYGVKVATEMAMDLCRAGVVLCSGVAEGIDSASIRGALSVGGTVISVLAGGLDRTQMGADPYLCKDVAVSGALLSEYPPGTPHLSGHFRPRNRIISGLSEGVVVVEGGAVSGSLITAHAALEQGREVFAVPGCVDSPLSAAPNRLIHDHEAQAVRNAADVLAEFTLRYPLRDPSPPLEAEEREQRLSAALTPAPRPAAEEASRAEPAKEKPTEPVALDIETQKDLTDDQRDLLLALGSRKLHPDELVEQTQIPARRVLSALTLLQMRGYVKEETGKRFTALVRFK